MPYYVYVLKNNVTKKIYKGQTQNLERRLQEHSQSKTKTTSHANEGGEYAEERK